jgi:elongation factor 1 alpha-like protein
MANRYVDDFDDDGLDDDYEGEGYGDGGDELSPEDREAMTTGTAEVRKQLGSDASKVTVKQIQDALWHYYYDVEKSVSYLQKTVIAPAQPKTAPKPATKKTPEGMSPLFSFSATPHPFLGALGVDHQRIDIARGLLSGSYSVSENGNFFPVLKKPRMSLSTYFHDMPWMDTPAHRHTVFVETSRPRGGLLGGGEAPPAMSKLQKLAAARKKKNDEKKDQDKARQAEKAISKLSLSENIEKENQKLPLPLAKRQKTSDTTSQSSLHHEPHISTVSSSTLNEREQQGDSTEEIQEEVEATVPKASPSGVARTLFGPTPSAPKKQTRDVFAMPYTLSSSFSANAFLQPSPDDIVLEAQAKGSNFAKAK